jgi:hypothetical protein
MVPVRGAVKYEWCQEKRMKAINKVLLGITLLVVTTAASAQKEQYIPVLSYRVGP